MQYEDRISVPTAEGIELELTLAGLGSRFTAALVDGIIRTGIMLALFFLASQTAEDGSGLLIALIVIMIFLVYFGYDVLFEVLSSGQTPGKRWSRLRVVRLRGEAVGFTASLIRNLLRIVDFLPGGYVVGIVSLLVTRHNQRIGDLAAGTIVVRDRPTQGHTPAYGSVAPPDVEGWDVSAVTDEEMVAVERFLERRTHLTGDAREALADQLYSALRPKVAGVPRDVRRETFLEGLVAAKRARR